MIKYNTSFATHHHKKYDKPSIKKFHYLFNSPTAIKSLWIEKNVTMEKIRIANTSDKPMKNLPGVDRNISAVSIFSFEITPNAFKPTEERRIIHHTERTEDKIAKNMTAKL